jgi:hypothetical protein
VRKSLFIVALIGLVAAAGVGAVAVLAGGPGPGYLQVSSWSAGTHNGNLTKLTVTTRGAIPRQPDTFIGSNPVAGLAWADLATGKVFVATIHPVLGRDSHQNPDSWHAHTATLVGGATAPNDFCVGSIDSTPTAGIAISGSTMSINVRSGVLPVPAAAFDAAVGFTVQPDAACASGLAVRTVV